MLVNNAGLMPLSPLDALKVDEWEQMVDVNIKGVLYGIAAALPRMRGSTTARSSTSRRWPGTLCSELRRLQRDQVRPCGPSPRA